MSDKKADSITTPELIPTGPVSEKKSVFLGNHSYLTEKNIGETLTITGKLQGSEGNWFLIEKYDSKSRVIFLLEVPAEFAGYCAKTSGTIVTVTGVLSEASAVWTKKLVLKGIK